jgi:hypothetical protein
MMEGFRDAVSRLEKLTESEDLLVGAETLTAVKTSERTLDGVSMTVALTNAAVGQISGDVSQLTRNQNFDAFRVATEESLADAREERRRSQQEQVTIFFSLL